MTHTFNSFSEIVFFAVFILAIGILLYAFVWQVVKDAKSSKEDGSSLRVTSSQVNHYFLDKGYVVCNITPVKNSTKWLAFLIKNGEYLVATVFTKGTTIEGHRDSLE